MFADLDIYRTASLLVKQHGQDAPIEAAMRADTMLDRHFPAISVFDVARKVKCRDDYTSCLICWII